MLRHKPVYGDDFGVIRIRVAILEKLSPDSRNLANFESVWLQKYCGLEIWQILQSIWFEIFWFGEM